MSRFLFIFLLFILIQSSFVFSVNAQSKGGCAEEQNGICVKVKTAIGDIKPDAKGLVTRIFGLVLGLSGGIALILFIISGYRFMTSGASPEAFQAAKEQLVSAIVGLLFIIFSFVILQAIGVDILHIPGFNP